jgi:hypothetical protein
MSNLPLNIPENVRSSLASSDLQHMLRNVEIIEKLKMILTLIDKAIEKYSLDGEKIAVNEYETLKIYTLRQLDNCKQGGLIFPNRIDERYGFRPGHVGYMTSTNNNLDETVKENKNKVEKLNESIERMESKITRLEQISYRLDHR